MSEKKRKSKRPKAMRVTTEASKAKPPAPKRKRKATPRETWAEGYAKWEAKAERLKRVRCPRCEKLVLAGPHDIHTCYDAKALTTPSPIAGQTIDGIGSAPLDVPRAIPCGEDFEGFNGRNILDADPEAADRAIICVMLPDGRTFHDERCTDAQPIPILYGDDILLPPDTSAYPWGLKFAWWLDGLPTRVRRWLAVRLRWLAGKVAP